jgi:hypothetical protein
MDRNEGDEKRIKRVGFEVFTVVKVQVVVFRVATP